MKPLIDKLHSIHRYGFYRRTLWVSTRINPHFRGVILTTRNAVLFSFDEEEN